MSTGSSRSGSSSRSRRRASSTWRTARRRSPRPRSTSTLRIRHHWPIPLAFLVAVVIVAPLTGLILDRVLFRHLRTASSTARLVTVLGLLVAIPQAVDLWFGAAGSTATGRGPRRAARSYNPFEGRLPRPRRHRDDRDHAADRGRRSCVLFRYTALGLRMRAVVESSRMTELAGVNAELVSMGSWMLASFIAGLAGVLIAPRVLAGEQHLLHAAGRRRDLGRGARVADEHPVAFAGGLALGVLQQILSIYLPTNSILATNLRPSLPFVVLFLDPDLLAPLRNRRELADPLGRRRPATAAADRAASAARALTIGTRGFGGRSCSACSATTSSSTPTRAGSTRPRQAVIFAIIFCSITVITGMAGQISLCQATFAGIGGFVTFQLIDDAGHVGDGRDRSSARSSPRVVGAMLAIPVLRLGGIYLSLATLAFALFFDNVMVKFPWVVGARRRRRRCRGRCSAASTSRARRASSSSASSSCCSSVVALDAACARARPAACSRRCAGVRSPRRRSASTRRGPASSRSRSRPRSPGLGGGLLAS